MPLVRSRSQSSSGIQSTNLFSGFQHWRRRRASNSVPSSPLATSATTNNTTSIPSMVGISRSSSVSESYQPNRLYPATDANEEEDEPSSNPTIHPTNSSQQSTTTELPTTDDQENIHIRLLPNVGLTTRCFIFDIIDRTLTPATILKIGRYSERHAMPDRLSFKSKVVSRTHAELWMEEGKKVFIRDIGSSSGTFVNRIRLSASNEISPPMELKDGDTIQLGVDYQGGMEQIYRSVKIRLEINRNNQKTNSFSRQAFQQLRQRLLGGTDSLPTSSDTGQTNLTSAISQGLPSISSNNNSSYIQECCICLYAIAPLQALFVAPCSHVFHFKCLRPIVFPQYPAFSCPLCRNYYDLEASVAIEVSEVKEAL
ncbi:uncharacterized protein BX664DRAFT_284201, partial [Halteromyces radiatus]|uniref:uncharacterized protein n=1 Tax=Halteromyces radiatus TaxID=101107 RepID=UPI00221F432D